jgi:hypothetical protein
MVVAGCQSVWRFVPNSDDLIENISSSLGIEHVVERQCCSESLVITERAQETLKTAGRGNRYNFMSPYPDNYTKQLFTLMD